MRYVVRVQFPTSKTTNDFFTTNNNPDPPLPGDLVIISTIWATEVDTNRAGFFSQPAENKAISIRAAIVVDVLQETDVHTAEKEILTLMPMAKLVNKDTNRQQRAVLNKTAATKAEEKDRATKQLGKELAALVLAGKTLPPPLDASTTAMALFNTIRSL